MTCERRSEEKNPSEPEEGELIEVEDGFRPGPSFPCTRIKNVRCGIPGFVLTVDDAIEPETAKEVYDYTVEQPKPWGIYVTKEELLEDRDAELPADRTPGPQTSSEASDQLRHRLARRMLQQFVLKRVKFLLEKDFPRFHGFALWALGSKQGDEVPYHLDYAELYRLETNIVHSPLYGVTLQLSDLEDGSIDGGAFAVNTGGRAHYARFGHRGQLQSKEALAEDMHTNAAWVTVPYKGNRGIVFDGSLPHCSTRVSKLPEDRRRVIVGINCFDYEIGPLSYRVAIHSNAFYRAEKLKGALKQLQKLKASDDDEGAGGGAGGGSAQSGGINIKELVKNKDDPMFQFLLKAARAKAAKQRRDALDAAKKRVAEERLQEQAVLAVAAAAESTENSA